MVCLSVYNQINLDLNTLFLLSKLQLLSFCPAKSQVSLKGTRINATSLCLLWLVIQREKLIKDHDEVMQYRKTVKHNISINSIMGLPFPRISSGTSNGIWTKHLQLRCGGVNLKFIFKLFSYICTIRSKRLAYEQSCLSFTIL